MPSPESCADEMDRELRAEITRLRAALDAMKAERDNLSDKLELERALTDGAHRRARYAEAERDELLKLGQAVVNLVEGLDKFGLARSAVDGERLKDEASWTAFYNKVAAIRAMKGNKT